MGWGGEKKKGGRVYRGRRKMREEKEAILQKTKKRSLLKTTGVFDVNITGSPDFSRRLFYFFRLGVVVKRAWWELWGQNGCNAGA